MAVPCVSLPLWIACRSFEKQSRTHSHSTHSNRFWDPISKSSPTATTTPPCARRMTTKARIFIATSGSGRATSTPSSFTSKKPPSRMDAPALYPDHITSPASPHLFTMQTGQAIFWAKHSPYPCPQEECSQSTAWSFTAQAKTTPTTRA